MSKLATPEAPEKRVIEVGHWQPKWMVEKFADQRAYDFFVKELMKRARAMHKALTDPDIELFRMDINRKFAYAVDIFHQNGLANAGINELWTLVLGTGGTLFNNANAYLGVGDSTDVFDATEPDLQAAVNKTRVGMEAGYPTYGTSQKGTFRSSFDGDTANHGWQEHAAFNAAVAGTMLNRKVEDEGTKTAGQVWVETLEITLS